MLISETSKVSVLYVTAKFSRKSNFSAKVLSSIYITSANIFVSTASSIFKDSCWSLRSTTTFAVTLFSHVVVLIMKLQRSHWITPVQVPWSSNGWTTVCVVVDNFFFPDHTLTCKLVSVYTKPVKRQKNLMKRRWCRCSQGISLKITFGSYTVTQESFVLVLQLFAKRRTG